MPRYDEAIRDLHKGVRYSASKPVRTRASALCLSKIIWEKLMTALLGRFFSGRLFQGDFFRANLFHQDFFPKNPFSDDRGQDIAEYAVLLAVILVVVVGTVQLIGSNTNNVFSNAASTMQ